MTAAQEKAGVDVLAVMDFVAELADAYYEDAPDCDYGRMLPTYNVREARATVAKLLEAGGRLQFTKQDGKFVPVDTAAIADFVVALANAQGKQP